MVLCAAGVANGDNVPSNNTQQPPQGGDTNGRDLIANVTHTKIRVESPGGSSNVSTGEISSADPNWEPPACWYEPVMTPEQLKEGTEKLTGLGAVNAHQWWTSGIFIDHYKEGKPDKNWDGDPAPGYKNYNLGKDGMFWRSVVRKGHEEDPKAWDCKKIMFWADQGEIPDVPQAISPKILAEYAYDKIRVPDTRVEMNPDGKQTVNLPTWMWLDKGTFKPVKVRASLQEAGLWAETTAEPVSLHIDPGTEDAQVFPASGDCRINDDGSIGSPYTKGKSDQDPPCGVTYLRSTTNAPPHKLKATLTWKISWEGSGGTGGELPDGTFGTTTDVTVQEVQAITR
ncbi:hypothetical protein [Streptomyces sp. 8N616]|uniref:hypothetical protein n=1 Tax=Streptomyces sp. 8N616 TaxID=3457414 RepID=UPI003FD0FA8D